MGKKLYFSNLDYGVSNEDIKGTAEVVFSRHADAAAAVKRCNNVQLDGKPMKIEMVGTNIVTRAVMPRVTNGNLGNPFGVLRSGRGRGVFMGRPRGRGRGGGGGCGWGGRGRGRGRAVVNIYLQKILMQIWTSTIQKQCKSTEIIPFPPLHL